MIQTVSFRMFSVLLLATTLSACATTTDQSPQRTAVIPIPLGHPIVTDYVVRRSALSPDGRWNAVWMTQLPRSSTPGHLVMADLENERYYDLAAFTDRSFVKLSWAEDELLNVFDSMTNGRGLQVDFSDFGESGGDGLPMTFVADRPSSGKLFPN